MWLCALVWSCFAACMAWGHQFPPPVVDTVHGKVLGKYVSLQGFAQPVAVFLGVPFAKPPLGSLRFSPPQPAEPWSYVKNTTSYPPMCSQDAVAGQVLSELFTNRKENIPLTFSEDCLYLNIYTPADLTKSSRLPVLPQPLAGGRLSDKAIRMTEDLLEEVMVWIHGGGLVVGGASTYDGLVLSAHESVVVVTIQYRLGIWGFFSTGDEHSQGNWGHLDQVAALRWVQDNIAHFGGNPGSVTIFGESAGGESVSVLVLSPLAKNLFHRAISESGVALTAALIRKDVKPIAEKVAITAGCKTTTSAVMVHCLRQKTEDELLETTLKLNLFKLDLLGDPKEAAVKHGDEELSKVPKHGGCDMPMPVEKIHVIEEPPSGLSYDFPGHLVSVDESTTVHSNEKEEVCLSASEAVLESGNLMAMSYPFLPTVIDGVFLPKTPEEIHAEKNFNTVPYIVGINKQEFGWLIPTMMGYPLSEGKLDQKTATSLLKQSFPIVNISEEKIPVAIEKYLGGTDDLFKKKDLFLDLIADVIFGVPSVIVSRVHRDAGAPTYMYEFQYRPSFSSDLRPKTVIADHGDELFSVFGAPFLKDGASEEEMNLSKMVMKFWANFARTGNPNGKGLPHWPQYDQKEGYLEIGTTTQAAEKLKDKEVAFWTDLLTKKSPEIEHTEL